MLLDFRPIQYPILLVATHDLAEQFSRITKSHPFSATKSPTLQTEFGALTGKHSILSTEGQAWKTLRKQFNAGFAPGRPEIHNVQRIGRIIPQFLQFFKFYNGYVLGVYC